MAAFDYPGNPLQRIHGSQGYANYASYRPWLRDEFVFRCVYCLRREQWGQVAGEYDLEHFEPQVRNPELTTDYDNLLYACHTCNLRKSSIGVPDPSLTLIDTQVRVLPDGSIEGTSPDAKKIILLLGLNSEKTRNGELYGFEM